MMRPFARCLRAHLVAVAAFLSCYSVAAADFLVAQTGFNNASGINSGLVPPAPYSTGGVNGQGSGEPNWSIPWNDSTGRSVVQSAVVFEGDQALRISPTSLPFRAISAPTHERLLVDQYVRVEEGARLVVYSALQATGDSIDNQGAIWQFMPDHSIRVIDGTGDGCLECGAEVVATWAPDTWYRITIDIDLPSQTWDFYLNGVQYISPDPLGFRGTPTSLDRVQYLSEGAGAVYLDALRIQARITGVPTPDTITLLSSGLVCVSLAWVCRQRQIVTDCFTVGCANSHRPDRGFL